MTSWLKFAASRARAALGLFLTLLALVAVTTGVIAGTIGYTAASASTSAREAVTGDQGLALEVRTRPAKDTAAQDALANKLLTEAFDPAPILVERVEDDDFVVYRVTPDVDRMDPDDLPRYAEGSVGLRQSMRNTDVAVSGLAVEGDLSKAAAVATENLMVSRALGAIPLSVLVLVTVLAVVQVARLLANSREAQLSLLVARGASAPQVFWLGAAESVVAVVVGAVLGTGVALGVLSRVEDGPAQAGLVILTGVACLVGTLAIVLGLLYRQVRAAVTPGYAVDRSGRASKAVTGATLALVVLAALITLWQLLRTGSPLTIDDEGTYSVNFVAGAAPALLLAMAGVVALALLGPIGALITALTHRSRKLGAFLTAAQISRRIQVYSAPVILTVLATGAATVAALYAGTAAQLRDDMRAVADGAPVRVELAQTPGGNALSAIPAPPDHDWKVEGIDAQAPVWRVDGSAIGDTRVPSVGVVPSGIGEVVSAPEGLQLIPEAFEDSDIAAGGLLIPEGTKELTLDVEGQLEYSKWGVAYLRSLPDKFREEVRWYDPDDATDEELEAAATSGLNAAIQQLAESSTPVRPRFFLRDVDAGTGKFVEFGGIELPGPVIDPATLEVTTRPESRTFTVELDPERRYVVHAARFEFTSPQFFEHHPRTVRMSVSMKADGTELFGDATANWANPQVSTPELAKDALAERDATEPTYGWISEKAGSDLQQLRRHNDPGLRAILDTSQPTWTVEVWETDSTFWSKTISPAFTPAGPRHGIDDGTGPNLGEIRVALTSDAAKAAALQEGSTFGMQVMNRQVNAKLVAIVDAVPGSTEPLAALVDITSLGGVLGATGDVLSPPNELWIEASDPEQVAKSLREQTDASVSVGGRATSTDPTAAARLIFWIACGGAILLAVTGIAAATSAMTGERRSEVAVLRALGMTPGAQAGSRAAELASVVLASVVFGLGAGLLVSRLAVPALAQSTIAPGQVALSPDLAMEFGPWIALMAAGAMGVAFITFRLARRVRAEALDDEYREEVR